MSDENEREVQRLADECKRANTSLAAQIAKHQADLEAHAKATAELNDRHAKQVVAMREQHAAEKERLAEQHKVALRAQEEKILAEHPLIAQKRAKLVALAKKHVEETKAAHAEIMAQVKGE